MDKSRLVLTACLAAALGISVAMAGPKVKRDAASDASVEEQKVTAATLDARESDGSTSSLDAAASLVGQSASEERLPATGASIEQAAPGGRPSGDPSVSDDLQPLSVGRTPSASGGFGAASSASAAFVIPWQSINAGGGPSSSANYAVNASVGQSTIGEASSTNYGVGVGYWYGASGGGGGCACDCHADPSCDSQTDVFDIVHAVNVGFRNESDVADPNPLCPRNTTDVDCDGDTDVFDVVKFVNVAFRNEPPMDNFCDPCAP